MVAVEKNATLPVSFFSSIKEREEESCASANCFGTFLSLSVHVGPFFKIILLGFAHTFSSKSVEGTASPGPSFLKPGKKREEEEKAIYIFLPLEMVEGNGLKSHKKGWR